jgi:hypothetical protein
MTNQKQQKLFTFSLDKVIIAIFILIILSCTVWLFFLTQKSKKLNELQIEACIPYNIDVQNSSAGEAIISWHTKGDCLNYVEYGTHTGNMPYQITPDDLNPRKDHSVNLIGDPGKSYFFVVLSEGIAYGQDGVPILINL